VRALEQASELIADGNYNHEIKFNGRDELAHLANSFNRMALALRQTEQKRKDLVADVSHELRTPLASIQGYTEVLRDGLVPSRERQEEILDHVLKEVKHLTSMVNSMREWVNNEQALEHLDVEVMPARYVADMVVERFRPIATAKDIELKLEVAKPEPQVRTDANALSHALSNLVDNALRYTPEGGSVLIKIEQTKATMLDKTPQINFIVRDTGCGIAAEHLPFIFERFYRVDKSRDRNTGGSGLGLAIVRDTVQTLGGEVKIESTPGEGTCILFSLPAEQVARPVRAKRKVAALKAG
jgi:histidine kinase